jgi:N-acetylmuramoyl-L-alanine amidase
LDYKSFSLRQPDRLVIDLPNTQLKNTIDAHSYSNSPITGIRTNQTGTALRLVLDLQGPLQAHVFQINPDNSHLPRLVIDLDNTITPESIQTSTKPNPTPSITPTIPLPNKPLVPMVALSPKPTSLLEAPAKLTEAIVENIRPQITLNSSGKSRDVIVVLDAGHGGHDSGALGQDGTAEKAVVLEITKELARQINQQKGMRAVLTRDDDFFIPLRDRLRLARKGKADMFIAVHADAYKSPLSSGASVFALSRKGASSEAARWLAEKENYAELGGTTINDKNSLLFSVLLDLSQTGTIRESLKLGGDILKELGKITRLHHNEVEQAPFMVLKSPDIPSLLIETGFISNPSEAEKLQDSDYQKALAQAMLVGIRQYFMLNPPPDSYFAKFQQHSVTHIVQAGENLASIANHYHISERAIIKLNSLSRRTLEIGQVIFVPYA